MLRLVVGAALLVSCAGCTTNPATGRLQFDIMDVDDEIAYGQQVRAEMLKIDPEWNNPVVKARVERIGRAIIAQTEGETSKLPWQFTLLDTDTINAFATAGGQVFICRGIMQVVTTDDQLAALLGHEIGHVAAEHVDETMTRMMIGGVATAVVAAAADDEAGERAAYATQLVLLGFNRSQESESDRLGLRYMTKARYNPRGMVEMLKAITSVGGKDDTPEFLRTHPADDRRIREVEAMIAVGVY